MSQIATRLSEYLIKAAREAKLRTNWHEPDEQYEEALRRFITALATGPQGQQFREDSRTIRKHMALAGALASLSQVLIKTAAPGIPDFYRGTELWDLSLVDPDNRRPVDFELRLSTLRQLQTACNQSPERHMQLLAEIVEPDGPLGWRGDDSSESGGAIKMYTMMRALAVRNQNAELFDHGDYIPLNISGSRASQLFAFARVHNSQWILTIAPRLMTPDSVQGSSALPLGTAWQDVAILLPPDAPTHWRSAMLPQTAPAISAQPGTCDPPHLAVADALRHFPVALLLPA